MISSKYRFHSRGGVKHTYKDGKTIRQKDLTLVFNENSRGKQRFAVVISKKILKTAVGRNQVRRRLYEAIRLELPNIQKPVDCIFIVYSKDLLNKDFKEIQDEIRVLLTKANIVK